MTEDKDLIKLIDELIHEKTFSLDAVEAVKNMRDIAQGLEKRNKELKKDALTHLAKVNEYEDRITVLRSKDEDWREREAKLIKHENKAEELRLSNAVSNAKAETYKECVSLIFRNETLRREMLGSIPVTDNTGYVMNHSTNETVSETKE